jgi:8-amino-7-oxononanoate synthase
MNKDDLSKLSAEEKKALYKKMLKEKAANLSKQKSAATQPKSAAAVKGRAGGTGGIKSEFYDFDAFPEIQALNEQFASAEVLGLENPYFRVNEGVVNNRTTIGGKEYISFSSYNYVGLSGHPEVVAATKAAIDKYGTSVSASRIATGERPIHVELEHGIADFVGAEDCVVFVSGHATNVTTIGHLFGTTDAILYDALSHNSILQGNNLSGARRIPFPHNDYKALRAILERSRHEFERVLIVIEGVYSMDGDIAELPEYIKLKKEFKTLLMVDEAHSIGVLGEGGGGIGEHFGIDKSDVDLWMGTLSKSFASCGGYIAGKASLVKYLKYTAPGFLYSVGMSPANTAAAIAALMVLQKEPERVVGLHENSKRFLALAKEKGLDTGLSGGSAVVPVIVGNSMQCLILSSMLFEEGINVQSVLYPAVAENQARLRFFITTDHTEDEIRETVEKCARILEKVRAEYADVSMNSQTSRV